MFRSSRLLPSLLRGLNVRIALVAFVLAGTPLPLSPQSSDTPAASNATLHPGDRVSVAIWREDDLSGSFLVDENGSVTLPLLGEVSVVEIPLPELRQTLVAAYRVHLRNPSIAIVPLRKVFVLGEVRNPGSFEVNPTESILGVIAQAGGATSAGNLQRVGVVRDGTLVHDRVAVELTLSGLEMRSGDQVIVYPRNWFARNQTFVISVLLALPSAVFTITRILE